MRRTIAALALILPVYACGGTTSTQGGGDCVSHYDPIADAPTRTALKRELREHVDPRVRTLKIIDEHPDKDKVYVNLLNRRDRVVMSLDMWKQDDGTWTAQRWSQCID